VPILYLHQRGGGGINSEFSQRLVLLIFFLIYLFIYNAFYVPESPFNVLSISRLTRSLDYVISFTKDYVSLQDQSSRQMTGTRCECHGLYQLHISAHVGGIMDF